MVGNPIGKLNAAVASLPDEMKSDRLAVKRVEIAIVSFPPVRTVQPFATADAFVPPTLVANGRTPLGGAVSHALRLIEDRKAEYRAQHLEWFRPWLFLVTDGEPDEEDDWRSAAAAVREAEASKKVTFFSVGVPGANLDVLAQFSVRRPRQLVDLRFREMFVWLTRSLQMRSQSAAHTGGNPDMAVPTAPGVLDWSQT
jgi:uncharacterized protein YegL